MLRCDNSNKLIFAHININSIRNKFEFLSTHVNGKTDVLMVSKTKIDNSFQVGNFVIDGFSTPYRLVYNDKQSSFKMLLEKDSSVFIHDRNIQCLATEMFKVSNGLPPPVVSNIFTQKNCHPYNLRLNS